MLEALFLKTLEDNKEQIYRICNSYAYDEEDAKDLFQEVIMNIWRSLPKFREESSISTWVYRITLNVCLRGKNKKDRRQKKYVNYDSIKLDNFEGAISSSGEHHAFSALYNCIKKLNDTDKSVILLFLEKLPYKEIAAVTGLTKTMLQLKLNASKQNYLPV